MLTLIPVYIVGTYQFLYSTLVDDMMIFAKSPEELAQMTEWLVEELSNVGPHLNAAKTKVLTTSEDNIDLLDIGGN